MTEIKLSGIYIYPIKSAAGFAVNAAEVGDRGFHYDRRWMVVDETGKFMTQRQFPRMALIDVQVKEEQLVINAPNQDPLSIPLQPESDRLISVKIWRDVCAAIPLGEAVSQWFSQFLETPCHLVFMPETSVRPVNPDYANPTDQVSFADAYPFLLISEASLEDLNQRLEQPIPMNRFRPNLVVSGCAGFAEDRWQQIQIGSVPFRVAKACDRCAIPGVDQATGIPGKEPLLTLARYRLWDRKIWFGQNVIQDAPGTLRVGDSVKVAE